MSLAIVLLLLSASALGSDLERDLQDQYRGKIFVLRGFYSDSHLIYDSSGKPDYGGASHGDWTIDGFVQVDDIHVSGQVLKIRARRLMVVSIDGFQFSGRENPNKHKKPKRDEALDIEAKPDSGDFSEDRINSMLSKIFLSSKDDFSEQVPEFWKPCIAEALSGKNRNCRFSAEITAVPGMSFAAGTAVPSQIADASSPVAGSNVTPPPSSLFKVGNGVKPPIPVYRPDPSFSERARRAKYHGTVTLALVVDRDGLPTNIHVVSPLGAGLDASAVQAVKEWKFVPAQKDGQPVAVPVEVEVDFHLY